MKLSREMLLRTEGVLKILGVYAFRQAIGMSLGIVQPVQSFKSFTVFLVYDVIIKLVPATARFRTLFDIVVH